MILKIFNGRNELLQFLIVIVFSILIYAIPITVVQDNGFNPLFDALIFLSAGNTIALKIIFIVFTLTPIVLTQFLLETYGIVERRNKFFLFMAPLLIFSNQSAWVLSPALISIMFLIVSTNFLFNADENDRTISKFSSAAIIFSIGSMVYSVIILNFLLLIIALKLFRQFNLRDVIAVIISFIIPYLFLFSYYFVNDQFIQKWDLLRLQFSNIGLYEQINNTTFDLVYAVVFITVSVFVISTVILNQRNNLIQVRKYIAFIFWGLINSVLLLFVAGEYSSYHFVLILFIVAIFYSVFLGAKKMVWMFEFIILFYLIHTLYIGSLV